MGFKWLKDLDLIQIKAMLWAGDPPLIISRQFLVTQGTVSNIKNGRIHYDVAWPDGSIGPMPEARAIELLRAKKMGMLRQSEIREGRVTGVGVTRHGATLAEAPREPTPYEKFMTNDKWTEDADGTSRLATQEEKQKAWDRKQEDEENERQAKEAEERAKQIQSDKERREYQRSLPKETKEERKIWEAEEKQEYARRHLFDRDGKPILENFVAANLSDKELRRLVVDDRRARAHEAWIEQFIKDRRLALAQPTNGKRPGKERMVEK